MDASAISLQPASATASTAPEAETADTASGESGFAAALAREMEAPPPAPADEEAADPGGETTADAGGKSADAPADLLALLQFTPTAVPAEPGRPAPASAAVPVATAQPGPLDGLDPARTGPAKSVDPDPLPPVSGDTPATTITAGKPALETQMPAAPASLATAVQDSSLQAWSAGPVAQHTPLPAAAAAMPRVEVPVAQPGWADAFSQRVVWLAGQQQHTAELHLNPPELGPVSIVLAVDNDQASVFFSSPHLPVREAIESALPSLREALNQAGMQLGETGVSAESFGRGEGREQAAGGGREPGAEAGLLRQSGGIPARARVGLVDTFA